MTAAYEVNFDGLVGPTHNYAGLSYGNLASKKWEGTTSNPRGAALEGLRKMKRLADLGIRQAVLPPPLRPDVNALRRLGFHGTEAQVLADAQRADPRLLAACCSASAMWTANAATMSPSADTADQRVHFTPANLVSHLHRRLETPTTAAILKSIFNDDAFHHHPALPATAQLSDEGAANHLRLTSSHGEKGLEIFVYGRSSFRNSNDTPAVYPARQTLEASAAIARLHQLDPLATMLVQQNPVAIDHGVFHNDVIAVANENVLLYHELAFSKTPDVIAEIRRRFSEICRGELVTIQATAEELPLSDAVRSYVFNSQLVTLPDATISLIAPADCLQHPSAKRFIDRIIAEDNPIRSVHYVDIRQSMQNGGGPACLRLRVVLTDSQLAKMNQSVVLTDSLYERLVVWVQRHYREELKSADLADPALLRESSRALDELSEILHLSAVSGRG